MDWCVSKWGGDVERVSREILGDGVFSVCLDIRDV